jgi:hypothetical protein
MLLVNLFSRRCCCCCKLQGPDASTELSMVDLLASTAAASLPLMPHLLRPPHSSTAGSSRLAPPVQPAALGTVTGGGVLAGAESAAAGDGAATASVAQADLCQQQTAQEQQEQQQQAASGQNRQQAAAVLSDSPCYSLTDSEEPLAAAAAAAAPANGVVLDSDSPLVQAQRLARQFGLNKEQQEVMEYVAGWAGGGDSAAAAAAAAGSAAPPICLVHGPFGSGEQWGWVRGAWGVFLQQLSSGECSCLHDLCAAVSVTGSPEQQSCRPSAAWVSWVSSVGAQLTRCVRSWVPLAPCVLF